MVDPRWQTLNLCFKLCALYSGLNVEEEMPSSGCHISRIILKFLPQCMRRSTLKKQNVVPFSWIFKISLEITVTVQAQ